jgi:hypothetical protein
VEVIADMNCATALKCLTAALILGAPAQTHAQQKPEDRILGVVTNLFDAMRARDTTRMRTAFAPMARLVTASVRNGTPTVSEVSVDAWIASVGRARSTPDERIFSPEVRVDGGLATVWMRYEFWASGTFSHCGHNAFQLALAGSDWKVVHIADSRRTDGCARSG